MKRVLKLISFFFAFNLEVRVHADMVFSPEKCWNQLAATCGAENLSAKPEVLKVKDGQVNLASKAIVAERPESYRLVNGKILVKSEKAEWSSLFATFKCVSKCLFILEREEEFVRALALEGNLQVTRLGDKKSYDLPQGFWVRVGAVDPQGQAPMEFPQSLGVQPTLKEWAELYTGELSQFKKDSSRLMPIWTEAAKLASEWQKEIAERNVAVYEAEQAKVQQAQERREREDRRLREIFRDRNYLNQ